MKIKSYAKINIGLKIFKDKGNETKHQIDSIFYLLNNCFDIIKIEKAKTLSIKYLKNKEELIIKDCLITKVLNYLKQKYDFDINYSIVVDKNIPIGAGLGGASSNAACVMNYLLSQNKAINLNLKDVALTLGSDIPFFLTQYKIARVKRYGEYVTPLMEINPNITILLTNIECSTKQIFNMLDEDKEYKSEVDIDTIFNMLINKQHNNVVYNDLTKYIIKSNTKLQECINNNPGAFFTGAGGTLVRIEDNNYENKN